MAYLPLLEEEGFGTGPDVRVYYTDPSSAPLGGYLSAAWGDELNHETSSPNEAVAAVVDLASQGAWLISDPLQT